MQKQVVKENEKRLVGIFKQFVNKHLIKHFRTSEDTMTEWNYFSSLVSQENIDYDKLQIYLEVMSPSRNQSYPNSKIQHKITRTQQQEDKKTNSGIYAKKQQQLNQSDRSDFYLNKTVGGNADRIKFTGMMFPTKNTPYKFESKDKKKLNPQTPAGAIVNLVQRMSSLCNKMQQNHLRMEGSGVKNESVNAISVGTPTRHISDNKFYGWKPGERKI